MEEMVTTAGGGAKGCRRWPRAAGRTEEIWPAMAAEDPAKDLMHRRRHPYYLPNQRLDQSYNQNEIKHCK
jgi:hypothetical protein